MKCLHELLSSLGFYGGVLTSATCSVMLISRVLYVDTTLYLPLGWNLILAWIPFVLSAAMLLASRHRWAGWVVIPLLAIPWLLFLPNAPYLITDLVHLKNRPPAPYWYDIIMLGMFGCVGMLLGVRSLEHVHEIVQRSLGAVAGWLFSGTVAALCGLGIYLGRFLRWNSWDLLYRPDDILRDVAHRVLDPRQHIGTWAFSAAFAVCLMTFYIATRQAPQQSHKTV